MSETTTIQISVETKKLLEFIKGWIIVNNISKKDKFHIGDAVEQIASHYKDNVIDKEEKRWKNLKY